MEPNLPLPRSNVVEWVRRAAVAVTNYLCRYPVKSMVLNVAAGGNGAVNDGVTHGGSRIDVRLGRNTRARDLRRDWILTHEMFRTWPFNFAGALLWMEEPLRLTGAGGAGARQPDSTADAWRGLVEGLPQGLPEPGERGLDLDHTWGRIYWGGSLYWLLADARIREQTGKKRSVYDAIRVILDAGGDGGANWSLARVSKWRQTAPAPRCSGPCVEAAARRRGLGRALEKTGHPLRARYHHFRRHRPDSKIRVADHGSITCYFNDSNWFTKM